MTFSDKQKFREFFVSRLTAKIPVTQEVDMGKIAV
jgi:hypothetical protein